jgi:hypothetical protein
MLDHIHSPTTPSSDFVHQHLAASQTRQQHIQRLEEDLCELAAHIDAILNASMILGGMGPVTELKTDAGKLFAAA